MLSEVYKLLRPGGVYFCVSHSAAATRLPYLAHDSSKPWRIEVARVEKANSRPQEDAAGLLDDELPDDAGGGFFHIYICTKPPIPRPRAEARAARAKAKEAGSPEMPASSELMPVGSK